MGVGLAFIYVPLIVIGIYAFNSSKILKWPPPGLTLNWFTKAFESESARESLLTAEGRLVATAIALVLGTPPRWWSLATASAARPSPSW